jgi:hypothetical protein
MEKKINGLLLFLLFNEVNGLEGRASRSLLFFLFRNSVVLQFLKRKKNGVGKRKTSFSIFQICIEFEEHILEIIHNFSI